MVLATTPVAVLEPSAETPTSPPPDRVAAEGPECPEIAAVQSLAAAFQRLLSSCAKSDMAGRLQRSSERGGTTVIEHVIYVRDLLHATAERLERLASDAGPVHVPLTHCQPIAGYHRWDAEELAPVLGTEAERLARITRELARTDRLPVESRLGLQAIAAQLVLAACKDSEEHIHEAQSNIDR